MGTQPAFPKRSRTPWRSPQFSAHVYCGQTAGWIKMALGMEVGLGPVHILLDGDTAPLPKKGGRAPPQFSAHLYCGQTAACIKIPLGMEVRLSPGDFVLDGDQARYPKEGRCCAPFVGAGSGTPSNTMWPGPRSTSISSGVLLHAAVWPQQTWAKNWGLRPFWGRGLGPHLTQSRVG